MPHSIWTEWFHLIRDALLRYHPEPCVPPASVLPCCDALPLFEDIEVFAAHVQAVMLLSGMIFCYAMVLTVDA